MGTITEHFSLWEFTHSDTAIKRGIANIPTLEHEQAIKQLCTHVLEPLRIAYGKPITISSGYRSKELNKAVGGSSTSQHCKGEAADLVCGNLSKIFEILIEMRLPFDQLIWENGWVHVSYSGRNRRQVLRWLGGSRYQDIKKTWKNYVK